MSLRGATRTFTTTASGNVVLIFALLAPVFAALMAVGVSYANAMMTRSKLQAAADLAALSAARELGVASPDRNVIAQVARNYAVGALGRDRGRRIDATANSAMDSVVVSIEQDSATFLGAFLPFARVPVKVSATATVVSGAPPCLLALEDVATPALALDAASIKARECAIYSNARDPGGLVETGGAVITAKSICSAGGFVGPAQGYTPTPATDCPVKPDPFETRPPPPVGVCTSTSMVVSSGSVSLYPGVYCGGLKVTAGATATLSPGVYVIKDGPLTIDGGASLVANNAGFYLTGAGAVFSADETTTIRLQAPTSGPLAGMLFYEDHAAPEGQTHLMSSRDAPELLGTFYLPRNRLVVGYTPATPAAASFICYLPACPPPAKSIAATSAWTIIVARQIYVNGAIDLVLNSNYLASAVKPPPEIVTPSARLVK